MEWIQTHPRQIVGGILFLLGLFGLIFPKAFMPTAYLEQLKKLHLPTDVPVSHKKSQETPEKTPDFPLALDLFLRFTGLLFAFGGLMILLVSP